MISYKIIHHVPGRIKIKIEPPVWKGRSITELRRIATLLSPKLPAQIKSVHPNPYTGNIVILYEHGKIDIIRFIEDLVSSKEVEGLLVSFHSD